jgi:acyl dehydratase
MASFDGIDALTAAAGQALGTTKWQVVSQERIGAFADITGDHQWIHVDEQRARAQSPFGGTVAHGALILALVPVFVAELVTVRGASMVVNSGLERVRFRAPVPAGAKVRGVAELLSTVEMAEGARAVVRATVQVCGERRPACVADQVLVFRD